MNKKITNRHTNKNRKNPGITLLLLISLLLSPLFLLGQDTEHNLLKIEDKDLFAKQIKIFISSPDENLKPTKWDYGGTTISNEDRLDLFRSHIENLRGGYIGVGSTQNFTLAAWAKSEWIWLMDFTRIVVAVNKIHITFLKKSPTIKEFLQLWEWKNRKKAMAILKEEFKDLKKPQLNFILRTWYKARSYFKRRQAVLRSVTRKVKYKTWLMDEELYNYLRTLALQGRIRALGGDLNGKTTFFNIGKAAKEMKIPVRVLYFSNAEEYYPFRPYKTSFRNNIKNIPLDEKTRIIRTLSISKWYWPWAPESHHSNDRGFHYNVMPAKAMLEWFEKNKKVSVLNFLRHAKIDKKMGFSEYTGELNPRFQKKAKKSKPVNKKAQNTKTN